MEVRVTPEQNALIRQAADLEDTTVTAFVLESVTTRAKRVVKQHQDLVLSNEAFDRFLAEHVGSLASGNAELDGWLAVRAGEAAAARLVVVDAIYQAAVRFYERQGFVPAPEHPFRLYRRITVRRQPVEPDSAG